MTKTELNRDIKKMYNKWKKGNFVVYNADLEKEFKRLYYADDKADWINLQSFKIMLTLNRKYHFVLHNLFYININL